MEEQRTSTDAPTEKKKIAKFAHEMKAQTKADAEAIDRGIEKSGIEYPL